jgi:hypothetical protein
VYGHVDNSIKGVFWEELNLLGNEVLDALLICGDFNALRFRHKKSGLNFQNRISRKFNNFLYYFNLFEYELQDRKFTWSNGTQFTLLDRMIGSLQWDIQYRRCNIIDLPKMVLNTVHYYLVQMVLITVHYYLVQMVLA